MTPVSRLATWLPRLVARVPITVHAKLLAAFLAIVVLLIVLGAVGLRVLTGANRRAEELVQFQRKIAAYRQLNHDTIGQLYSVVSSLLKPDARTLDMRDTPEFMALAHEVREGLAQGHGRRAQHVRADEA